MNKRLIFSVLLVLCSIISYGRIFEAVKTEQYSFPADKGSLSLDIDNIYGGIIVTEWDKPFIEIVVEKKTETDGSQESANDMLSCIQVDVSKEGSIVRGRTAVDCSKRKRDNNNRYFITYKINIPVTLKCSLRQKYGDIEIRTPLTGRLDADVKYGGFNAVELREMSKVSVMYGMAKILKANSLELKVMYGGAGLDDIKWLNASTSYSDMKIKSVDSATIRARYDKYEVENSVGILTIDAAYTNAVISGLKRDINAHFRYGDFKLRNVFKTFEDIEVKGEYVEVKIELSTELNYTFDVNVSYAKINMEKVKNAVIKEDYSDKRSQSKIGVVGTGLASGKVRINSNYGNVLITNKM
jgi:hypothetical protein